jgi:hypothetical protein
MHILVLVSVEFYTAGYHKSGSSATHLTKSSKCDCPCKQCPRTSLHRTTAAKTCRGGKEAETIELRRKRKRRCDGPPQGKRKLWVRMDGCWVRDMMPGSVVI